MLGVSSATMSVVPEPGACRAYEFPSQRVYGGATIAGKTAGDDPTCSPTRLISPKKRSRQGDRRQHQRTLPTAPGLRCRPDSGSSSGNSSGGGGGGGGGFNGSRAAWRKCNNKENIDPRTGRPSRHPFSPFSPVSASLLASGSAIAVPTTVLSAAASASASVTTATTRGGTSGRTSSVQKRMFCGSGCGEGGRQFRLRPTAAASPRPFGEPLRER
eukprot:g15031.t1